MSSIKPLNVLFLGLGSIGNRHSKNLRDICEKRGIPLHITALRSHKGSLTATDFPQIDEMITELDGRSYDIAFITNPTTLHREAYEKVRPFARCFFVEKPIFADTATAPEALGMTAENTYVAAPMRFTAAYMTLKKKLAEYTPFSTRIICSSYLPDWRPNQDYRKVYSARRELGGGVAIDLIHEIDYMVDLFGFADSYYNVSGHYSHLEIDTEDLSVTVARYPRMLCEVHLDYFGRTYRRQCECFTPEGSLIADFGKGTVTLPTGEMLDCTEDVNARYVREMEAFLAFATEGGKNLNPPALAFEVLKISLGEK